MVTPEVDLERLVDVGVFRVMPHLVCLPYRPANKQIEEGLSRSDQSHIYQRMQMKKSFPAFPHISMIKRNVTISWPKLTNQPE